ncbi:hypothetical protein PIB30_051807 [Stylosanthes scabra]|uniref:PB1 domain-containing protein n=1 Tax=Stylosanthes scabra TaxID=79078 RepID=A0ABU6VIY1_9FABA|nr:hypothetical protein [Stylosanthes scabra]
MENCKAKFICSYGGKIQRDTHDHTKLSYVGGHTKILYIQRTMITFPTMLAKLAALFNAADGDVSFKYQLPGEDFDSLISVTDDNDLENMMIEYDQLRHTSATPARLRLFLFPNNNPPYQSLDSDSARPDMVISKPNGDAGVVVGTSSSFCSTLALPSKPDNDIIGSVDLDQYMDQCLLEEQFFPSIAGSAPYCSRPHTPFTTRYT